jgi:hypothetical protein
MPTLAPAGISAAASSAGMTRLASFRDFTRSLVIRSLPSDSTLIFAASDGGRTGMEAVVGCTGFAALGSPAPLTAEGRRARVNVSAGLLGAAERLDLLEFLR